jgi:hypothetical protein
MLLEGARIGEARTGKTQMIWLAIIIALLPSLALAQALPQPKPARRLLPAWLHVVGIVLRAPRGRAGRDPLAAERDLPARMDALRQLLPAERQSALICCLRAARHRAG